MVIFALQRHGHRPAGCRLQAHVARIEGQLDAFTLVVPACLRLQQVGVGDTHRLGAQLQNRLGHLSTQHAAGQPAWRRTTWPPDLPRQLGRAQVVRVRIKVAAGHAAAEHLGRIADQLAGVRPPFLNAGLHDNHTVDVVVRDPGAHGHVSRHSRLDGLLVAVDRAHVAIDLTAAHQRLAADRALEHTGRVGTGAELARVGVLEADGVTVGQRGAGIELQTIAAAAAGLLDGAAVVEGDAVGRGWRQRDAAAAVHRRPHRPVAQQIQQRLPHLALTVFHGRHGLGRVRCIERGEEAAATQLLEVLLRTDRRSCRHDRDGQQHQRPA